MKFYLEICTCLIKCEDYGLKKPEFYQEEDFRVVIWRKEMSEDTFSENNERRSDQGETKMGLRWDQVENRTGLSQVQIEKILDFCIKPKQMKQIIEIFGATNGKGLP